MNFTHLVGNTPMIRIRYRLDGQEQSVWAKLEAYNLSGSIKDRLAAHVITKSTANGTLKPGPVVMGANANVVYLTDYTGKYANLLTDEEKATLQSVWQQAHDGIDLHTLTK